MPHIVADWEVACNNLEGESVERGRTRSPFKSHMTTKINGAGKLAAMVEELVPHVLREKMFRAFVIKIGNVRQTKRRQFYRVHCSTGVIVDCGVARKFCIWRRIDPR